MEFYLLEELDFDLIIHHAYRSLTSISENFGRGKGKGTPSTPSQQDSNATPSKFDKGKAKQMSSPGIGKGLSSLPPKPGTVQTAGFNGNRGSNSGFGSRSSGMEVEEGALEEDGEIGRNGSSRGGIQSKGRGDGDQSIDWEIDELDEQALQMAW